MDRTTLRNVVSQFIAASAALLLLLVGCTCTVWAFLGKSGMEQIATSEADELSNIELNQLYGTADYQGQSTTQTQSIASAVAAHVRLPFSDPLKMLTSLLPETSAQAVQNSGAQTSLFQSITTIANNPQDIVLGWLPSTSSSSCIQLMADNPGMNVVSPGWLHLQDASGNLSGSVLPSVIEYAHQHNIKVWVMVDNQFSATLTHEVLANPKAESNLVDELVYQSKLYHLDGINIDFENLAAADRNLFTQFIGNLHRALSPIHVNLSVDISPDIVPLDDSLAFFHAGLADNADEIVLMAYDEHWSTDPDPGPVADLPWVTAGVNDLLDTGVPTDKLILGMPFYTRFWYVHSDGSVTSSAVSAGAVTDILHQDKAPLGVWDPKLDLMYTKFPDADGYTEVWYPTANTYQDTLSLVTQNGLAGVAVWSLAWSDPSTWTATVHSLRTEGVQTKHDAG
ncbi:hypothetical protein Alches_10310 [Alicyclobacillus hesperidum subsp. aegles]|uniref:glycosyl hydrolase family 18 protein n=1 Tax=Alicyclobacillus hesperidum TaxID=89784 RepID=UPI00222B1C1D|nr:glycosyl hydrolase family 18 protein [Alicyclobacillus hesperidum]GLG00992.1 hypothetical protein Alches_10310 [Alicyclobacillus hesperidum subsp. aegles]